MPFKYVSRAVLVFIFTASLAAIVTYLVAEYLKSTGFEREVIDTLVIMLGFGIGGLGCIVLEGIEHQRQHDDE